MHATKLGSGPNSGNRSEQSKSESSSASTTRTDLETSRSRSRSRVGDRFGFGRYLSSWRRGDIEEDFWRRDDEKEKREREKEKEKESGYSSGTSAATSTNTASAGVSHVAVAGRRNEGITLPSVLVSEASGGRGYGH